MTTGLRIAVPDDPLVDPLALPLRQGPLALRARVEVRPWARLGESLDGGDADVALLPAHLVIERAARVEIVPGISVASEGAIGAARLLHTGPLREVRTIESRAPGHVAEWLVDSLFVSSGAEPPRRVPNAADAILVAGRGAGDDPASGLTALDLGAAWSELTGLPFVWYLWAARPDALDREGYALLHTARTRGRHALAPAIHPRTQHRLGSRQLDGLAAFWAAAARAGLAGESQPLRFLPLSQGSACRAKAEVLRAARSRSGLFSGRIAPGKNGKSGPE